MVKFNDTKTILAEVRSQPIKVALVLVNYNGKQYLEDLFLSLQKMNFPHDGCDIFFVDNASHDGSVEWVREHVESISFSLSIIENPTNEGFAGGNNRGIERALQTGGGYEYVALLNIDTTVHPSWLGEMVSAMEQDSAIGAVQSLILFHDTPDQINTSGNVLHYLGFGWSGGYKKLLVTGYSLPVTDIGYASGAAVLYRSSAFQKVGFLEERFFMYHEDLELSWRLRLAGYRIVCSHTSLVYHKYQFSRNKKKWFWVERNRLLTFFTLWRLRTIFVFIPAFVITELGILFYSVVGGWFLQKLYSYREVFASLSWIRHRRARIASFRQVSDRAMLGFMTGRLDFPEIKNPLVLGAGFFLDVYLKVVQRFV